MQPDHHLQRPFQLVFSAVKGWTKLLFLLVGFLCFLAGGWWLYCLRENEAGRREWAHVKAELEAKGESFNWAALLPVTVPDEENFAKAPVVERLVRRDGAGSDEKRLIWSMDAAPMTMHLANIDAQTRVDIDGMVREIVAWSTKDAPSQMEKNPAGRVIDWFDSLVPLFKNVQTASHRPQTQFAVDLSSGSFGPVTDYVAIRQLAQQLAVLGAAYLGDGRSEDALNCIRANLAMSRGLQDAPMLVDVMIGVAVENLTISLVWQGLVDGDWNDEQLEDLDRMLRSRNWLASLQLSMRTERAALNDLFENTESPLDVYDMSFISNSPRPKWKNIVRTLIPIGWSYRARSVYSVAIQDFAVAFYDPLSRRARPSVLENWSQFADSIHSSKHPRDRVVEAVVPNFSRAFDIVAKLQVRLDQA